MNDSDRAASRGGEGIHHATLVAARKESLSLALIIQPPKCLWGKIEFFVMAKDKGKSLIGFPGEAINFCLAKRKVFPSLNKN